MSRKTSRRDKPYRQWIHTLACLVCERQGRAQRSPTEAHHAGVDRGMAMKPPDSTCIPLCGDEHHRNGRDAWHRIGRDQFELRHGIDVDGEIRRLNREYEATGATLAAGKPKKRITRKPAESAKPKPMSERLREWREKKAK